MSGNGGGHILAARLFLNRLAAHSLEYVAHSITTVFEHVMRLTFNKAYWLCCWVGNRSATTLSQAAALLQAAYPHSSVRRLTPGGFPRVTLIQSAHTLGAAEQSAGAPEERSHRRRAAGSGNGPVRK